MIPTRRLLAVVAALAALALLAVLVPTLDPMRVIFTWILIAIALVDALRTRRVAVPQIEREVPPALAIHRTADVCLDFQNRTSQITRFAAFDHFSGQADIAGLPGHVVLAAGEGRRLTWTITPRRRGWLVFDSVQLRVRSPGGLWNRLVRVGLKNRVRVLPDFSLLRLKGQELDAQIARSEGFRRVRQRGLGTDFHQLREFRQGDSINQIDWKATARHTHLIAREYEAERGQQVVILLDASRRMRSADGHVAHFDMCLMSALRLAHVAISHGDAVGCMTFGGVDRWCRPRRSVAAANAMLDVLFDVQPTLDPPDYRTAAGMLLSRQRRRALVVLVTNLRDEDGSELLPALRTLAHRHLVVVASLRESFLDDCAAQSIQSVDDALLVLATDHYLAQRRAALRRLRAEARHLVDVPASDIAPALISQYLAIKQTAEL